MDVNPSVLNAAFSRRSFKSLLGEVDSASELDHAVRLVKDTAATYGDAIHKLYHAVFREHRNEYVYKNTLFNKIILGRHSMRTSCAFEEFHIADSIADFVVINGKATVYEIKTDLDNLDRLTEQLANYYKAFDNVYVVCGERNSARLAARLCGTPVGIIVLTDRGTLSTRQEAERNAAAIRHSVLFDILRKHEREFVICACGKPLPNCRQVEYYAQCKSVFSSIPLDILYPYVLQALKLRCRSLDQKAVKKVPYELRLLGYMTGVSDVQADELSRRLMGPI